MNIYNMYYYFFDLSYLNEIFKNNKFYEILKHYVKSITRFYYFKLI